MNDFVKYTIYKDKVIYCNSNSSIAWFMVELNNTPVYAQIIWDLYTAIDISEGVMNVG